MTPLALASRALAAVHAKVVTCKLSDPHSIFPVINATLNGASAVLLLVGRWFISRQRLAAHRATMIAAFVSSGIFLVSYVYFHAIAGFGSVHFQGGGWSRPVYFTILISH